MKRALLVLAIVAALLSVALPAGADDASNMGLPPPAGHVNCNVTGWDSHAEHQGSRVRVVTVVAWLCDDGVASTTINGEWVISTTSPASVDRHCRSHTEETRQVRPHRFRYVTRLITDCDDVSRVRVLHRSHWHHR